MIDVGDLPGPVAQAVRELDGEPGIARVLRVEAMRRMSAAMTSMQVEMWHHAFELLGLALGYLTAATRIDAETKAA